MKTKDKYNLDQFDELTEQAFDLAASLEIDQSAIEAIEDYVSYLDNFKLPEPAIGTGKDLE